MSELTLPGVVVPMVSAIENRSTPRSRAAAAMSSDPLGRRGPLERAVPRGGDDDLDGDVTVVGDSDDLVDLIGGLGAAAPDVGRG